MRRPPPESVAELMLRANALAKHSIGEIAAALGIPLPSKPKRAKGFVGQLMELALGASPDAFDQPDFPHLGIELKTIPIGVNAHRLIPRESTFVCSVSMATAGEETWEGSRLLRRLQRVLFIPIDAANIAALPHRYVHRPYLWQPCEEELAILRTDWEDLMGALGAGYTSSISAHRGRLLQLRPKARSSRVRTIGTGEDGVAEVLPLGFYLRARATHAILVHGRLPL